MMKGWLRPCKLRDKQEFETGTELRFVCTVPVDARASLFFSPAVDADTKTLKTNHMQGHRSTSSLPPSILAFMMII